jgi:hypothetical protein
MRLVIAVLVLTMLAPAAWATKAPWGNKLDVRATLADKLAHLSGNHPAPQPQVGGDNIATAVPIAALPFNDTGSTCGYLDDYDVVCPYSGSTSPDVVYQFTPASNMKISIDLCDSQYDTKVFVFDGSPANVVACNDDAGCGYSGYQSRLDIVQLVAGHTYYIVVDGYGGDCGDYDLTVAELVPCDLVGCKSYDQPEIEPDCYDGYDDTFDGGCNSEPAVFQPVGCGTICGTSGTYVSTDGYDTRDTDWYELTVGPGNFTYTGVSDNFNLLLFVLQGTCDNITVVSSITTPSCVPATLNFTGPGTFWLWAGPTVYTGVPCGSAYRLDIVGPGISSCEATPAAHPSWGQLKLHYR